VVSPVLANLFLHYAFDVWMDREFPSVWFERYADDAVLHCVTERQAREVLAALTDRMAEVGLHLHPAKTRIVYCQDGSRPGSFEHTAFTFLGYTFRARRSRTRHGRQFLSFDPAVSRDALKKMGREVRSWHLHTRTGLTFNELARRINPVVAGWINYYGRFRPWELLPFLTRINAYLVLWIRRKYKRLAAERRALAKMQEIAQRYPRMFAHWRYTVRAFAV
jgi:RNA-directed DNA polymerase